MDKERDRKGLGWEIGLERKALANMCKDTQRLCSDKIRKVSLENKAKYKALKYNKDNDMDRG